MGIAYAATAMLALAGMVVALDANGAELWRNTDGLACRVPLIANLDGAGAPEVVVEGECVNCNLCEMICPDFAIFSVPAPDVRIGADDREPPRPISG